MHTTRRLDRPMDAGFALDVIRKALYVTVGL